MPVAPSFQDLYDVAEAELKARRPDLLVTEGDITDAFLHGGAAMGDLVLRFAAQAFRDTFLDGASGDALTALVDDHYGLQRDPATQAQAQVTISRPFVAGAEPAGTMPAGSIVATTYDENGETIQFTLDADAVWILGELSKAGLDVTAVETGRESNVDAGEIQRIVDMPSFDTSFTVTNPAEAGGGNPEESDEDLRSRAKSYFLTLRRGTLAALEYGALQVSTVRIAIASEDTTTGIASVRVSDLDGNSTPQMIADVETELENWRCAGSVVNVYGGTQLATDVTCVLVVRTEFTVAARVDDFEDAIESRMEKLRVGETLYLDMLIGAIIAVAPDDVYDVTFSAPTGDVIPAANQVIRAGTITVS